MYTRYALYNSVFNTCERTHNRVIIVNVLHDYN